MKLATATTASLFVVPVSLSLRPSRRLMLCVILLHALVATAFIASSLTVALRVCAVLLLVTNAYFLLRREGAKQGALLTLLKDSQLSYVSAKGECRCATVNASGCVDWEWAVWLQWSLEDGAGKRQALMLFPDHFIGTGWRQLKIWLRSRVRSNPNGKD